MNLSTYHLTTASKVLSHLNSKLWKVPDKFFLLPTGHCLLWVRQSGRCVMMLGQSQHSSDSQQSPGSHSQGSNAMKQHNSTRLSETYFYLCILPLLQRMHSSIFSIDPFISDNRNWVFCANKSNRVYSLWFCVCSILARVSIVWVWELRVRILRGVTKRMQQLTDTELTEAWPVNAVNVKCPVKIYIAYYRSTTTGWAQTLRRGRTWWHD